MLVVNITNPPQIEVMKFGHITIRPNRFLCGSDGRHDMRPFV